MGNAKSNSASSSSDKAVAQALSRSTSLSAEQFKLHAIGHHGVPHNAKVLAFCGEQGILAVGTATGTVKLYGGNGFEVLLHAPGVNLEGYAHSPILRSPSVTRLNFTGQHRLIATYSDSSIRTFDFLAPSFNDHLIAEVSSHWTTFVIVAVETMPYFPNYPFFYVATDDGHVHVIHEVTGKISNNYTITPQAVGVISKAAESQSCLLCISAMASNPQNCNQLLLAYEGCDIIYLWDVLRRRTVREYSLTYGKSGRKVHADRPNAVRSISWHRNGKHFVAAYLYGGFSVFHVDKARGMYRMVGQGDDNTIMELIHWVSAPPSSTHTNLAGAIFFTGGSIDRTESCNNDDGFSLSPQAKIRILYPPLNLPSDDALMNLVKGEIVTWKLASIGTIDKAKIIDFAVNDDQVDSCLKIAPFSMMILSGSCMDGLIPRLSVQPLPAFTNLKENNREEWEWKPDKSIRACNASPSLQHFEHDECILSTTPKVESISLLPIQGDNGVAFLQDLKHSWLREKELLQEYSGLLDYHQGQNDEVYSWPLSGGTIVEPLLHEFCASTSLHQFQPAQNVLLASTATGAQFWELICPADSTSRGLLIPLYNFSFLTYGCPQINKITGDDIVNQTKIPGKVSTVAFCQDARILVFAFTTGEVICLQYQELSSLQSSNADQVDLGEGSCVELEGNAQTSFRQLFVLRVSTKEIKMISLATSHSYAIVADSDGMVFAIDLKLRSQTTLRASIQATLDMVESILFAELVQITEIPTEERPAKLSHERNAHEVMQTPKPKSWSPIEKRNRSKQQGATQSSNNLQYHRESVPVLFIGRERGRLEMFYVHGMIKIAEFVVDPRRVGSVSSILMVDLEGKPVLLSGEDWKNDAVNKNSQSQDVAVHDDTNLDERREVIEPADADASECSQEALDFEQKHTIHLIKELLGRDEYATHLNESIWKKTELVEVCMGSGTLGLQLCHPSEERAVVQGFVDDHPGANVLASQGVRVGDVIVQLNRIDVTTCNRNEICMLLDRLKHREKCITFAHVSNVEMANGAGLDENRTGASIDQPIRFLICTCDDSVHLLQAVLPKASDLATGYREISTQPVASARVRSTILLTSLVRVPVPGQLGVEHCVVVLDQSRHLYLLSLLSLRIIWEQECMAIGSILDGVQFQCTYDGELVVLSGTGELERFSLFSESTARDNVGLQRRCVKTRIYDSNRQRLVTLSSPQREYSQQKKNKSGSSFSDAGKLFKKLVTGSSAGSSPKEADLTKLFEFMTEEQERRELLGNRSPSQMPETSSTQNLGVTKNVLMQTAQRLHERGDKLRDIGLKTEQMKEASENFYQSMKAFNEKNAKKKWYEP
uniref:Uncharacterized protein AlNc14C347G10870 n=1 Tax=Albugo laibachii Nc14 TaxID=890382 RepID=F0WXB8_9STRA|nr:conserved hypothetical protein [Albugo laibachii Nc14]|eukprot:CCA26110.1 conserved hypothetical protein [Albugo laibachii Nc14]